MVTSLDPSVGELQIQDNDQDRFFGWWIKCQDAFNKISVSVATLVDVYVYCSVNTEDIWWFWLFIDSLSIIEIYVFHTCLISYVSLAVFSVLLSINQYLLDEMRFFNFTKIIYILPCRDWSRIRMCRIVMTLMTWQWFTQNYFKFVTLISVYKANQLQRISFRKSYSQSVSKLWRWFQFSLYSYYIFQCAKWIN